MNPRGAGEWIWHTMTAGSIAAYGYFDDIPWLGLLSAAFMILKIYHEWRDINRPCPTCKEANDAT